MPDWLGIARKGRRGRPLPESFGTNYNYETERCLVKKLCKSPELAGSRNSIGRHPLVI